METNITVNFCPKCNAEVETYLKENGPHTGEHCKTCDTWIRWRQKDVPYDPSWVLDFGDSKGTKISMLRTELLEYYAETQRGHRKVWFETALRDRYVAFATEAQKLIRENGDIGMVDYKKLGELFLERHGVKPHRFDEYMVAIVGNAVQKPDWPITAHCGNGRIWFGIVEKKAAPSVSEQPAVSQTVGNGNTNVTLQVTQ